MKYYTTEYYEKIQYYFQYYGRNILDYSPYRFPLIKLWYARTADIIPLLAIVSKKSGVNQFFYIAILYTSMMVQCTE